MTKEQFFTFKSDFKKGMRIEKLYNSHRKAYWNEGFATKEAQNEAKKKDSEEINSLRETISWRKHKQVWVREGNGYKGHYEDTDETYPIILSTYPHHHWAYYIAKHQLDENTSKEYIKGEISKMTKSRNEYGYYEGTNYMNEMVVYDKLIKPILDAYEKIVCTD